MPYADLLPAIAEKLHRNELILFVGSGMSAGCYPTWTALLNRLIDTHLKDHPAAQAEARALLEKHPLDAAWVIQNAAGQLHAKLAKEFERKECPAVEKRYEALKGLPFRCIFTTNYDHFLDDGRTPVTPDAKPVDLYNGGHVLHLHGMQSRPSSMILTALDFTRAKMDQSLTHLVESAAANYSFVFVGYSMEDEDVRLWLERCCYLGGSGEPRHWALVDGRMWGKQRRRLYRERYGVELIDAELTADYPDIVRFLGDLREVWTPLRRKPGAVTWTVKDRALYVDPLVTGKDLPGETSLDDFMRRWLKEDSRKLLVLLGEFGTGKTWFSYRGADLVSEETKRTPVVVKLGNLTGADENAVADEALRGDAATFLAANRRGEYVLFLDAFDEMRRSEGLTLNKCFEQLQRLATGKAKVVLTCRKEFFRDQGIEDDTLRLAEADKVVAQGVEKVEVQKFDEVRIEQALKQRGKEEVFVHIRGRDHLMNLASRPVVLNLLANYRGGFTASTRSVDVYAEHLLDLLALGRTDGLERRRRFAERLAIEIQKSGAGALHADRVDELARSLGVGEEELETFRSRSLLVRQVDHFAFGHASFREYLVARQIAPDLERGVMPSLCARLSNPTIAFLRELWRWTPPAVVEEKDGMVRIPAGIFICGEGDSARVEEIPEAFWLDKYPVTNARYLAFLTAPGVKVDPNWIKFERSRIKKNLKLEDARYAAHPVTGVTWYGAWEYAKWAGKRLPTEWEWEKAARGVDGREYPWGDGFEAANCNARGSGPNGTTPVTQYGAAGASPYGCVDMAGNVWEWTDSDYTPGKPSKSLRGGSWGDLPVVARCAVRISYHPENGLLHLGFRCART